MPIIAILSDVVIDDSLYQWLYLFRRHQFMACLYYHRKYFSYLLFIMRLKVPEYMCVEGHEHELVSANHARDQAHHQQLHFVSVCRFTQFCE